MTCTQGASVAYVILSFHSQRKLLWGSEAPLLASGTDRVVRVPDCSLPCFVPNNEEDGQPHTTLTDFVS